MNNLIFNDLKVIYQGFTGKMGTYHSKLSIDYKTNVVGGVSPGKGGIYHLGKPVFDTVYEAVKYTDANASVIFVPAETCKDSIIEAVYAGIKLIVCITEGIPVLDVLLLKKLCIENNVIFIGPNSPGFVIPDVCRLGIMPINIHKSGNVGIVSRSGTLTYEAINQTSLCGLGQSISIGIGGDPIIGFNFIDSLTYFNSCNKTEFILIIGEIGGFLEEKVADFLKINPIKKPIFAYIAGVSSPRGKRMGHAGAIISSDNDSALNKIRILKHSGISIIESICDIGSTISNSIK